MPEPTPLLADVLLFVGREQLRRYGCVRLRTAGDWWNSVYLEVRSTDLALLNRLAGDAQRWRVTLTPVEGVI